MNNMKSFKNMADEVMQDINVSDSLKEKVLQRCTRRQRVPVVRLLATAACGVLILGILNFSGVLKIKTQPGGLDSQGPNIFSATSGQTEIMPGQSDVNIQNEPGTIKDWLFNTMEEAAKNFGSAFLVPSFIPEGFTQGTIYASGTDSMKAEKVILGYAAGERSFMIIEQKSSEKEGFLNFKTIDINGTEGYLKPETRDSDGLPENGGKEAGTEITDTELHWFKDGVHYSVSGMITQEDAVKVARSMKSIRQ